MSTFGFLRVSRRLAPGISVGATTRGRSAGFFVFLIVLVLLAAVIS